MAKKHGPNKENLEATRRAFLAIARKEFSEVGYYKASTAKIVAESGMARGSLYYHFGDKKGLFRAVYEEIAYESQKAVKSRIVNSGNTWDGLMAGCLSCLDFCTSQDSRRIIVDVYTALSYKERMEILKRTVLHDLQQQLKAALAQGYFKGHDLEPLSIILLGFLSEAGRSFELSDDVLKAREDIGRNFVMLMEKARA